MRGNRKERRFWEYNLRLPDDKRMRLAEEKAAVLQDYFDQQSDSLRSDIRVVHHDLVEHPDSCYAQVVGDVDELFKTSAEKK